MSTPHFTQFLGLLVLFLAILFVVGPFLGRYMRRAVEEGNFSLTAWGGPSSACCIAWPVCVPMPKWAGSNTPSRCSSSM
jgi:hypothetical protein